MRHPLLGLAARFVKVLSPDYHLLTTDLLPVFRTRPSMISDEGKGKGYVEEPTHRGADDRGAQTTGSGSEGRGCGAGGRGIEAHDLRLESEVRWDGCERGAGSQAVAG